MFMVEWWWPLGITPVGQQVLGSLDGLEKGIVGLTIKGNIYLPKMNQPIHQSIVDVNSNPTQKLDQLLDQVQVRIQSAGLGEVDGPNSNYRINPNPTHCVIWLFLVTQPKGLGPKKEPANTWEAAHSNGKAAHLNGKESPYKWGRSLHKQEEVTYMGFEPRAEPSRN